MYRQIPRSVTRLLAAVALPFAVVACGGAAPTATLAAQSAERTTASSVAPTLAPESLTQTLTAKAGGRSVRYPAGWVGTDNLGILYVVTSMEANDRLLGTGRLNAGEVFMQFSENSILTGMTDDPALHLPDNLKLLASGMGLTLPAPVAMTAAGRPGARIDARNEKLAMIAISLKVRDDLFADVIAYVPPGEQAGREKLILAVVESLTYPAT
jgi:hypothetical protein